MRFSIVFDENGTILNASLDGEEKDNSIADPSIGRGYFEISDDLPDAELNKTVERLLIDLDARKLEQSPARGEAHDSESD
jgi:hypothetical protein